MNADRLKRIICYSREYRKDIAADVKKFCAYAGIDSESEVLNFKQIVRDIFFRRGYFWFDMPFEDDEIGGICYKDDGLGYVVMNTSLPEVNYTFALAHETYHVLFQESQYISTADLAADSYFEHEDEYAANLFASMLLMPENSFIRMYSKFIQEDNNLTTAIIKLMAYYKVPYMAVLIRCLELDLCDKSDISPEVITLSQLRVREIMEDLWLDVAILDASAKDDCRRIERILNEHGQEGVREGYITESILKKALANVQTLSKRIKEGV